MPHSPEFLDMMDEESDNPSSEFLRNFLARWQKYSEQRTTAQMEAVQLIFQKMIQALEKMKNAEDFRNVLEFILEIALEIIPLEKSSLILRNKENKMHVALSKGAYTSDQCLTADHEFIQRVLRNKESLCLSEPHEASAHTLLEGNFRWFIPLRSAQKFFGILYLEGKEYHNTPEKFLIGQLMAELVAEALSKSYLIQQNITAWRFIEVMRQKVLHFDELAMRGKLSVPVGHELQNLLTIISENVAMIKSEIMKREHGTDLIKNIDLISSVLQSAEHLAQQLCVTSCREPMIECSLNEIIRNFVELVYPLYKNKPLQIIQSLSNDLPAIKANPNKIRQLLFNLVTNAIQAKDDVRITISTCYSADEARVKIKIKDDGPGIPQKKLSTLFAPMIMAEKSGHGLGLAICKEIVDQHRGAISVESASGKGTEITISLPIE